MPKLLLPPSIGMLPPTPSIGPRSSVLCILGKRHLMIVTPSSGCTTNRIAVINAYQRELPCSILQKPGWGRFIWPSRVFRKQYVMSINSVPQQANRKLSPSLESSLWCILLLLLAIPVNAINSTDPEITWRGDSSNLRKVLFGFVWATGWVDGPFNFPMFIIVLDQWSWSRNTLE